MSKEEQLVASSGDVTQALRRTYDMMATNLSRSDFAHKTLKESTAALAQLSDSYSSLDTMLSSSRDLLGTLMKSQKSDTWYLETSFYLLVGTIGWLVFRRFLYGPIWLMAWIVRLPLGLIFKGAVSVSNVVGHHGGNDAVMVESPGSQPASAEMNNEDLPTIQVAQPQESLEATEPPNDDSMVEELGRMIDESKHGAITDEPQGDATEDERLEITVQEGEQIVRDEL
jgi:protein transport protein SEC20